MAEFAAKARATEEEDCREQRQTASSSQAIASKFFSEAGDFILVVEVEWKLGRRIAEALLAKKQAAVGERDIPSEKPSSFLGMAGSGYM